VQVLHGEARHRERVAFPGNQDPIQIPVNQVIAEFPLDLAPTVLRFVS